MGRQHAGWVETEIALAHSSEAHRALVAEHGALQRRAMLDELASGERWILDGFGPLDVIERRFARATTVGGSPASRPT